jgi:hypothetical protein
MSVQGFTQPGTLPSAVFAAASPKLQELQKTLPPGYSVIVSHVIVLFDFIEEMHEKGEP